MELTKCCESYFDGFCEIGKTGFDKKACSSILAVVKIIYYFTVIIPLIFGIAYFSTFVKNAKPLLTSDNTPLAKTAAKVSDVSKGHFYIIGGGIAGLNTALLLMREGVSGRQITLFEADKECGGLFYRNATDNGRSFYAHTVRTFDEPSYHYTQQAWGQAGIWNKGHLISRNRAEPRETIPADMRKAFFSIALKSDAELEKMTIGELLPKELIATPIFRYLFHLTGLFEHHSALSLKRYMTHTHGNIPHNWVLRSATCDYESIIEPIVNYLKKEGVCIQNKRPIHKLHVNGSRVTGMDEINLASDDKVIVTVGANVRKDLFPKNSLIYDTAAQVPPKLL